jgi:hypothetical protein
MTAFAWRAAIEALMLIAEHGDAAQDRGHAGAISRQDGARSPQGNFGSSDETVYN